METAPQRDEAKELLRLDEFYNHLYMYVDSFSPLPNTMMENTQETAIKLLEKAETIVEGLPDRKSDLELFISKVKNLCAVGKYSEARKEIQNLSTSNSGSIKFMRI